MELPVPLLEGRLIRRYKRFLADVTLDGDRTVTAHCPNTGSMLGCDIPGSRVWLSEHDNPKRKYRHSWELVEADAGVLVGIHTGRTNRLVREAIESGVIGPLQGYGQMRAEAVYDGGRFDFLLGGAGGPDCYVEVKNVTAAVDDGVAIFPDARSTRGTRHLDDLVRLKREGHRAVMVYCAQRNDAREVRPADDIDPDYGRAMRRAAEAGVELLAYRCELSTKAIRVAEPIPVVLP